MPNVLAIINTHSNGSVPEYLWNNVLGWSEQQLPGDYSIDVVISDVTSLREFREDILSRLKGIKNKKIHFYLHCFDEMVPVFINFNSAVRHFNKRNNYKYDYYVYVSEDCIIKKGELAGMLEDFSAFDNVGQVSALVTYDNAAMNYPHYNPQGDGSPMKIKLTESVNNHFSIWSKRFMEKYDYRYPDVCVAWGMESVMTFLHAAVGTCWVLSRRNILDHKASGKHKVFQGYGVFRNFVDMERIFEKGMKVGFGFECWREQHWSSPGDNYVFHEYNKKVYNENGECINKSPLYEFIKENVYLKPGVFSYDDFISKSSVYSKKRRLELT